VRLIPILALTLLLAIPTRSNVTASQLPIHQPPVAITAALEKAKNFKQADLQITTTRTLIALIPSYGKLEAPTICDIKMPTDMWWLVLVASECTGADPNFVATVLRFESDFRVGSIGRGTYVGPGGIHNMFSGKFPIHDLFGNIMTTARRLAQFTNMQSALAGYNKDRSSKYYGYCRTVLGWTKRLQDRHLKPQYNEAWAAAIKLGAAYLGALEHQVLTYRMR
jgi:hypothetical protein